VNDPRFCDVCGCDIDGNDPHHPLCTEGMERAAEFWATLYRTEGCPAGKSPSATPVSDKGSRAAKSSAKGTGGGGQSDRPAQASESDQKASLD
jgi:hypothetical protein